MIIPLRHVSQTIGARQTPAYFRRLSGGRSTPLQSAELLRLGKPAATNAYAISALTQ
jgi:hypothetical protein